MILFWFYFSGLSNRIIKNKIIMGDWSQSILAPANLFTKGDWINLIHFRHFFLRERTFETFWLACCTPIIFWKWINCKRKQILSFGKDVFSEGRETILKELIPLKAYSILLKHFSAPSSDSSIVLCRLFLFFSKYSYSELSAPTI